MELEGFALGIWFNENDPSNSSSHDVLRAIVARKSCAVNRGANGSDAASCTAHQSFHFCVNDPPKLCEVANAMNIAYSSKDGVRNGFPNQNSTSR